MGTALAVNSRIMDIKELLNLIDVALAQSNEYTVEYYGGNKRFLADTEKVLNLLRAELEEHPNNINERVLRAMHDVGVSAVKEYDPSNFSDTIGEIISILYHNIEIYKKLEPLRMDFGKQYPI